MPQLDYATYASQLFWLMIVFWSFYLMALRYILPTLSEMLKLREKKLKKSQATLDFSSTEQKELVAQSDSIFQQVFAESRQILVKLVSYSNSWREETITDLNTKDLKDTKTLVILNKNYLDQMALIAAKKYLLINKISN